ncbi:MAG: D-3-phosphoglycerate dehydrogenase [Candidatus Hecatellales archaeon B24]|nr:MAG: D-3-phosphoglycerate dehydrogenase [Candidatus Hecatellales archaeon B24]
MVRVLVSDRLGEEGLELLRREGFKVDVKLNLSPEQLKEAVKECEALLVRGKTKVTREILEASPNLKLVVRAGVGLDNVDLKAAGELGVKVENTPEAVSFAVAELTVALMLAVARRLPEADRMVKGGGWSKEKFVGLGLRGKTLGIIGLGRIGCLVARTCRAMDMRVIFYDIVDRSEYAQRYGCEPVVSLEKLLSEADIVSVHVPLTPETRHMIGEREIALMKPGAILINTSRGAIVDEQALVEALKTGRLGGAGLDVYEEEPPRNMKLLSLPNVVCTPHIGAQTSEAQKLASITAARKVIEFFKQA